MRSRPSVRGWLLVCGFQIFGWMGDERVCLRREVWVLLGERRALDVEQSFAARYRRKMVCMKIMMD